VIEETLSEKRSKSQAGDEEDKESDQFSSDNEADLLKECFKDIL
jgi:hypothetical protein